MKRRLKSQLLIIHSINYNTPNRILVTVICQSLGILQLKGKILEDVVHVGTLVGASSYESLWEQTNSDINKKV